MKILFSSLGLLASTLFLAQSAADTIKSKEIESVTLIAKKPTVENKADRTVFNVANSSILAGNTTWDIVRMTPLVSIDNDDNVKAEGEAVTVYINDRKSVFTGKELKEYLKTIPADNLMKAILSPSRDLSTIILKTEITSPRWITQCQSEKAEVLKSAEKRISTTM